MKIYNNICELIGNTPLVRLEKLEKKYKIPNILIAKLEKFNPGGSSKDRIAYEIILDGLKKGKINSKTTLIEATSGNTGIGLAMVCAYFNLKLIIIMSESVTIERIKLIQLYGATVILTKKEDGIEGAINKAHELVKTIPNNYFINQFNNNMNPLAHYQTTSKELIQDLEGKIDILVAGMGSGGTITGIAKGLKEFDDNIKIIGVEPSSCPYYSKQLIGKYNIPGIGTTFMPSIVDMSLIDDMMEITDEDAKKYMEILAKEEGILAGYSSGAVLAGTIKYLKTNKTPPQRNFMETIGMRKRSAVPIVKSV